jgi:GNAT superfamily N-acetyltransferase
VTDTATEAILGFSRYGNYYELEIPFGYVTTEFQPDVAKFRIGYVFVEPEHRGDGHGRHLTEQAIKLAQELGAETVLATLESSEGAGLIGHMFGSRYTTDKSFTLPLTTG